MFCGCYVEHCGGMWMFCGGGMWIFVEECGCFVDVMWNIVEECGCFVAKCGCNVDPPHLHISQFDQVLSKVLLSFGRYFHMQMLPILTNCLKCHIYKEIPFIYELGKPERQRGILPHVLKNLTLKNQVISS